MKATKLILTAAAIMVMAVAGSVQAQSQWGVGAEWSGGSFTPNITIPIKLESGLVLTPMVGFSNFSVSDDEGSLSAGSAQYYDLFEGTQIRIGLIAEKQSNPEGLTPLFGACAAVHINSPDADNVDSWTDFQFGGLFGGSAPVAEGLDFVGMLTLKVTMFGEGGFFGESATSIDTGVGAAFRWWIGGR